MKNLNEQELNELNHCMATTVMGWTLEHEYWVDGQTELAAENDFKPATNKHDAFRVLEKISNPADYKDFGIGYCTGMEWAGGNWYVYLIYRENRGHLGKERVNADTLELAICLFAKHLRAGNPWPSLSILG